MSVDAFKAYVNAVTDSKRFQYVPEANAKQDEAERAIWAIVAQRKAENDEDLTASRPKKASIDFDNESKTWKRQ
jgi:hypothetical protein